MEVENRLRTLIPTTVHFFPRNLSIVRLTKFVTLKWDKSMVGFGF